MANIKSDNDGFLIGEPLDLNRTFELWSDIRNDMRAIRMALNGKGTSGLPIGKQAPNNRKSDNERMPQQPVAIPQRRDESPKSSAASTRNTISTPLKPAATPGNVRSTAKVNANAERDTKTGRFTKNGSSSPLFGNESAGSSDRYVDSQPSSEDSTVRAAASKIADAVSSASSGMEETDPAIKAFSEVAQPMARGYEILTAGTGREQKDTFRWFRKIFSEIKLFRKDETAFNKAANRSLKNIDENSEGGNSGGDGSWLRRYILPMLMLALPLVMAGVSGAGGAIGKAWDSTVTDFKTVATKILSAWDSTTEKFNNVLSSIGSKIDSFWNTFTGFVKDKFGIDIPKAIKPVAEKISEKVSGVTSSVKRAYDVAKAETGSLLENVTLKGYRHKAMFDGIKGGDDLAKYGTYTDFEANRIRTLKNSAANTSANIPGGMSQEIQDKISARAKKYGLDPVMMQKIAAMESGGNPNAISKTGALGLFQFTGQTASGVGIKNRFDVDQNIEGGMKLTSQNMAMLKKSGLPVTAENIYMMHQLGPSAAQEIIRGSVSGKSKADLSSNTQRSMSLNYGANSRTAAEYIDTNRVALDKRYAATVGNVQTAHAQVPESPRMPAPQLPADEPSIVEPLVSNGSRNQNIVASAQPEVGQDVKDRRIAHIVTGGLSN